MFNFNMTLNPHEYLVLFVSKTLSVVWYFIIDLIPPKVRSYFTLFESKSMAIFICIHCLIISFKLCKFTQSFPLSKSELLYSVLSRSLMMDFILFYFYFYFYFLFLSFFYFQNSSGQGLSVTLSHQSKLDGVVTRLITGLRRMKQKELEQSDVIQHEHYMLASCITHGHLGQGVQQLAWTMGYSI